MSRLISASSAVAVLLVVAAMSRCVSAQTDEPSLRELTRCSSASDCASSTCCITAVCINKQYAPTSAQCAEFPCELVSLNPSDPQYACSCSSSGTCQAYQIAGTPVPGSPNAPAPTTGSPIPNPFEILLCSADSDCRSASCCVATGCVNRAFAPDCGDASSSLCPTFSVSCGCDDSRCALRSSTGSPNSPPNAPVTPRPSSPPGPIETFPDSMITCSANGDCATASCCISTACVNRAFAPDCTVQHASVCPTLQQPCVCSSGRCAVGRSGNQVIVGDNASDTDQGSFAAPTMSWGTTLMLTAASLVVCGVAALL